MNTANFAVLLFSGRSHGIFKGLGRGADHSFINAEGQAEVTRQAEAPARNGQNFFFLEQITELHVICKW